MITHRNSLDICPGGVPLIVRLSQYDSSFTLIFDLFSRKGTLTVENGTTARFRELKPDGKAVSIDATISGTTVTLAPSQADGQQITAIAGECKCELSLFKGDKELNTANFIILVEKAVIDKDTLVSDSVLRELVDVIDRTDELIEAAHEIEENVDPTLSISGKSADAKVAGDRLNGLASQVSSFDGRITQVQNSVSKKVNIPLSGNIPYNGVRGQVLTTEGDGSTKWTNVGTPTDEQAERFIDEWLDEHPEATTTVEDGSLTEQKLHPDLLETINNSGVFVTPQAYGAVGDGVTDDALAISECLHANKAVYIPRGYYRISSTIQTYCRDLTTVICDKKAIFIADESFSGQYMFVFSQLVGYSLIGCSWTGGIFCCNGVDGLTAILVNQYCTFGRFTDITVIDVGDNGTGIEVNCPSGKNVFDKISILGQTFNIHVDDPSGNLAVLNVDLTRNNTGFKNTASYDYAIGDIYIMACRIGILSNGGQQINVGQYHYWVGTNSSSNKLTWAEYQQTRAFKSLTEYDNWHFDMFYPDKPYIAFEGTIVSIDNVHYICAKKEIISDRSSDLYCYLFSLNNNNAGSIRMNNVDINYDDSRMEYRGGLTVSNSLIPYRHNRILMDYSRQAILPYLTPGNCINNSHIAAFANIPNTNNYVIGYVCISAFGSTHMRVYSEGNGLTLDFDILAKNYTAVLLNVYDCKGNQAFNVYVRLGIPVAINGYSWVPVMVQHGASASQNVYIDAEGSLPFQPVEPVVYSGSTFRDSSLAYNVFDHQINGLTISTTSITISPGFSTVDIAAPVVKNGYTVKPGFVSSSCSGTNGSKIIVTNYDSTNNKITVYNPTTSSITGIITLILYQCKSHN